MAYGRNIASAIVTSGMTNRITLRDLQWLLLSLALVAGLHAANIAIWVTALIAAAGLWRYLIETRGWQLPRAILLLPLTALVTVGILVTYRGLFGRDASVALLAIMLALKLMETQTRRDTILLVFGGYFLTITAFLFNQSMLVGAFMLLPLIALTAALVGCSHPNGNLDWRFQTRLSGSLLAQAAPLMLVMFLLFPRVPGPLWGVPRDAYQGMTGLSDFMEPGAISQLSLSGATAFRVEFMDEVPSNSQLYWRGPVLWNFDGRTWHMDKSILPAETLLVKSEPARYAVTLEPHNRNWLLMLDMPTGLPEEALQSHDRQVLSKRPVRIRIRYEGASVYSYVIGPELDDQKREMALQLPPLSNQQSRALARQWVSEGKTHEQIVQAALTMFREQEFVYTLTPPGLGVNSVDEFLFNTRSGFCEHYAGSFVFLMRAAGVPARVVTGYQGGELNPVGNYLIVRQSDAHAWAEVWLEGRGWLRVDPTAAVAPQRIESGISSVPAAEALPVLARRDFSLLRKLYLNWDALNNGWNQWVLGYNKERQMELLSRLTGSQLSWRDLAVALIVFVSGVLFAIAFFLLREGRSRADPLQKLYAQFLRKLEKAGLQRQRHEGPHDFGRRAAHRLPAQAHAIEDITNAYINLRYNSDLHPEALASLKQRIKAFRIS
jgi:transglutaminase-like putative cysteine protease